MYSVNVRIHKCHTMCNEAFTKETLYKLTLILK